jgi:hypothetical protein
MHNMNVIGLIKVQSAVLSFVYWTSDILQAQKPHLLPISIYYLKYALMRMKNIQDVKITIRLANQPSS